MSDKLPNLHALDKADEIIAENPSSISTRYLVALAYLQGRIEALSEVRPKPDTRLGLHEFDCICQRCGRRAGSQFALAKDAPQHGYFEVVCFHCSAGDEPRAA